MFIPVSIDQFISYHQEANPEANADDIRAALTEAIQAKKNGTKCGQCGSELWAAGSAVAGQNGCFTCITGDTDNSEDFEIDSVCN